MNLKLISFCLLLFSENAHSQSLLNKCGYDYLQKKLKQKVIYANEQNLLSRKVTLKNVVLYPIPVIFHILLTEKQISDFRDKGDIGLVIEDQMRSLNMDFNARNSDTNKIPVPFKSLLGNTELKFALAKIAPNGEATLGYEIKLIANIGFEADGDFGSGIAFCNAKYNLTGGLDAWDPSIYLNVWIINPVVNGHKTNLAGLTISPSLTSISDIPKAECGVILNYNYWDNKRTLTHELGHFFGLRHIWGDDDGLCPSNGGEDDGIEDTPPQSQQTYGCPSYPLHDDCSPNKYGRMFMNYMDYTDGNCQYMFTKEQAKNMYARIMPGSESFSLTQNPWITDTQVTYRISGPIIYPLPASSFLFINFDSVPLGLQSIRILYADGQIAYTVNLGYQTSFFTVDMSGLSPGMYLLQIKSNNYSIIKKIMHY